MSGWLDWLVQAMAVVQVHGQAYSLFAAMLVATRLLGLTPLGRPLAWAETFYHELSHGIACLLTLGRVHRIQLRFDGSGVCTTQGGVQLVILLAGYTGAAVWGGLLYLIGALLVRIAGGVTLAQWWLTLELGLLAVVTLLWVRDLRTLVIVGLMAGLYAATLWSPELMVLRKAMPWVLQFMGLFVLGNAILAPLDLIDGRHAGDGAQLQDLTKVVPEGVWVLLWCGLGLYVLGLCAAQTLPGLAGLTGLPRFF